MIQSTAQKAGPSQATATQPVAAVNSMRGLPASLDVERFSESRAFEINAMHQAMDNAKDASTHRAWQELPRHLRRRAASHNPHRVPVRLQQKAQTEMDPAKKKAVKRALPKRSKTNKLTRTEELLRRQVDKTWLETHIWHAKRMHMETKWGYRLASTPTEKSARPSYRASAQGAIIHDASYHGIIEIIAPQKLLLRLLDICCDPQAGGPRASRFVSGSRACETKIYSPEAYPFELLGTVTIIWRPQPAEELLVARPTIPAPTSGSARRKAEKAAKARRSQNATAGSSSNVTNIGKEEDTERTIWIVTHPAIYDGVFRAVHQSAESVLRPFHATESEQSTAMDTEGSKGQNRSALEYTIEIKDLREQLNIFEIIGPLANQVVAGALKPVQGDKRAEFKEFWAALGRLQSSGQLPRSTIAGFTVQDPRLNFPPKNSKAHFAELETGHLNNNVSTILFNSVPLARSGIWDESVRGTLRKPRFKKKDIDARKASQLTPGKALPAMKDDNRVPVLLIQHSVSPLTAKATNAGLHGWVLITPSGWGMPFWSSLTFTGARTGGLHEREGQHFEVGKPAFPRDYVATASYADDVRVRAEEQRARWERTPKSKRVNYEHRGVDHPWEPDWMSLLGLTKLDVTENANADAREEDLVPTQRYHATISAEMPVRPWILCGSETENLVNLTAMRTSPVTGLHEVMNCLRSKRGMQPLTVTAGDLWRSCLLWVRLDMCGRGNPPEGAMLYSVDDVERREWRKAIDCNNIEKATKLGEVVTNPSALCGFVTTGGYSLLHGKPHAVAVVPISRLFELIQQAQRLGDEDQTPFVKIRGRNDLISHAAKISIIGG